MYCIWENNESGVICINCGTVKKRATRRNCALKKGFGDTIENLTKKFGFKQCGGCTKRKNKINHATKTPAFENARMIYTGELVHRAVGFCSQVPPEIDGVCGVPRSGMIPASVIATQLHLPLYSVTKNYVTNVGHGQRFKALPEPRKMLFVDDTVASGAAMRKLEQFKGVTSAIFVNPRAKNLPDLFDTNLELPHILEWNLFNSGYVNRMAFDMDGVICQDQPLEKPLDLAQPRYLPRREELPAIITGRFESDRETTEIWLKRWGIRAKRLIMFDGTNKERNKPRAISDYKAREFKKLNLDWFVESCQIQAAEIAERCGAWVICTANGEVY